MAMFPSPAAAADDDLDRWANVESWEGEFTIEHHLNPVLQMHYEGTVLLDDKQIYMHRRQSEWKSVRWQGTLEATGNYRYDYNAKDIRTLVESSAPAEDRASLKIDKQKGTYSLSLGFRVPATVQSWLQGKSVGTEEERISIAGGSVLPQPLPESGTVLKGSATLSGDILPVMATMGGGTGALGPQDYVVSWSLWPKGSNPKPTLEFAEQGEDWIPEDDNSVEAVLKWEKDVLVSGVRFTLYDISEEPGTSLNSKDRNNDPDLEFDEQNREQNYELTQSGKTYIATKDKPRDHEERILIHAKDFGAYGKLKAEVKVNGSWIEATAKPFELQYLPVPYDKNENDIADKWEKDVGVYDKNLEADWDEDPYPQGQKSNGDGFTLYEEYRGFQETGHVFRKGDYEQVKDGHVRMDPMYKDLFIYDPNGLFVQYYKPYNPADLNWHLIELSMMKQDGSLEKSADYRWVNFNTSKNHFVRNQYAIYLLDKGVSTMPGFENDMGYNLPLPDCDDSHGPYAKYEFPLRCHYTTAIYVTRIGRWANSAPPAESARLYDEQMTTTVIHELGHSVGIRHHYPENTDGVRSCAIRYEHSSEKKPTNSFLKTRYCTKGETYIAFDGSGPHPSHNCYGQINIKGN